MVALAAHHPRAENSHRGDFFRVSTRAGVGQAVSHNPQRGCNSSGRGFAEGHKIHLYSVAAITNTAGQLVERSTYAAYGKRTLTNSVGAALVTSAVGNTTAFTGRSIDSESGLMYFRARMYAPTQGRFPSRDQYGRLGMLFIRSELSNDLEIVSLLNLISYAVYNFGLNAYSNGVGMSQYLDPDGMGDVPPPPPSQPTDVKPIVTVTIPATPVTPPVTVRVGTVTSTSTQTGTTTTTGPYVTIPAPGGGTVTVVVGSTSHDNPPEKKQPYEKDGPGDTSGPGFCINYKF